MAFLLPIVTEIDKIVHWKFKLTKYFSQYAIRIGIYKIDCDIPPKIACTQNIPLGDNINTSYVLEGWNGHLLPYSSKKYDGSYSKALQQNDIIDMSLDMDKLELSFTINDNNYGVAFKVDKCKYRAAVYLYTKDQQIDLIVQ